MTFLNILGVTGVLCIVRLVLEGKTIKEIPKWLRLEFFKKFLVLYQIYRRQLLWAVEQMRYIIKFSFVENTMLTAIREKLRELRLWDMMGSFVLVASASLAASRTLYFRFRRFIMLVQTQKVISMNSGSSTSC